jgi:hypothetical protein
VSEWEQYSRCGDASERPASGRGERGHHAVGAERRRLDDVGCSTLERHAKAEHTGSTNLNGNLHAHGSQSGTRACVRARGQRAQECVNDEIAAYGMCDSHKLI